MPTTDDVLGAVLTHHGVASPEQLPSDVKDAYYRAQVFLRDKATGLVGGDSALASALGNAVVSVAGSALAGDPVAVGHAVYAALAATMVAVGGPIGAAIVGGLSAIMAAIQAVAPQAHGGPGLCGELCGDENWYGGFILGKDHPPEVSSDPRWIKWTNKTPRKGKEVHDAWGHGLVLCSDDVPTISGYDYVTPCNGGISGQYAWLEDAQGYPLASFDHALAGTFANLLERYVNAQGPMPMLAYGAAAINLRDVAEHMLSGWNAIHLPGIPATIDATKAGHGLARRFSQPGDVAAFVIAADSREKSPLTLNTGPLVPELAALVTTVHKLHLGHVLRPSAPRVVVYAWSPTERRWMLVHDAPGDLATLVRGVTAAGSYAYAYAQAPGGAWSQGVQFSP